MNRRPSISSYRRLGKVTLAKNGGKLRGFVIVKSFHHFFPSELRRTLLYFKNTVNLFIHIARIPIGDSPRVHPNILKCLLHSPVAKGYRLVVIASRAMVCKTPTYYLILYPLAYARGCVILTLTHSHSPFAYFAYIPSYSLLIILSEVL